MSPDTTSGSIQTFIVMAVVRQLALFCPLITNSTQLDDGFAFLDGMGDNSNKVVELDASSMYETFKVFCHTYNIEKRCEIR